MQTQANSYLTLVKSLTGSSPQANVVTERHLLSLAHKASALTRLTDLISKLDLVQYVAWDHLHSGSPSGLKINDDILAINIASKDHFRFVIAFLVESFLSYSVSFLDVLGREMVHSHDLVLRGLGVRANLRSVVDKMDSDFHASPLTSLWTTEYPQGKSSWIRTLKELRNYYLHEDICGSVIDSQMNIMLPSMSSARLLLHEGSFTTGIPIHERDVKNFCPTTVSQLTSLETQTYALLESQVKTAGHFPL